MAENWEEVLDWLKPKEPPFCPEQPSLPQKVFLRTNALEAMFGGAAGGGKSSALLMAALQYVDVPGYSALLFRRTLQDLTLPGALMDRFVSWMSNYDDVRWNANSYTATFPSGARIGFGYLNNKDDYLRYKGVEIQFCGMDEVTEIRETDYRYLFSRLRRPNSGPLAQVPLRMRCATNPAPNWVRQRFLVEGPSKGRVFVPSKLTDNPGIDPESYRRALQELPPEERKRLEEGDWWVTSLGTMFDRSSFTIVDPFELPEFSSKTARMVRFWDLAGTEPSQANPDPDWTVGTLVLYADGIAWVVDVRRARVKGEKVEHLVAQTADGLVITLPPVSSTETSAGPGEPGGALTSSWVSPPGTTCSPEASSAPTRTACTLAEGGNAATCTVSGVPPAASSCCGVAATICGAGGSQVKPSANSASSPGPTETLTGNVHGKG